MKLMGPEQTSELGLVSQYIIMNMQVSYTAANSLAASAWIPWCRRAGCCPQQPAGIRSIKVICQGNM
eukprot:CAMPEP_0202409430 /NCGR_PEP_ID=MMETSP1128-20130828/16887_1 /ASSEMBLY_ACC=CAM_ASM_000463 /TAXON_ID=3047 /ORGANISM="Dunaliella tertiolecta, Strain CCMP1320" /LENGTH=66 /DNA_ID=CAMNT_0049014763 /DNA_START=117 /DNA_END=317 /DNA_ORIENTATION=-